MNLIDTRSFWREHDTSDVEAEEETDANILTLLVVMTFERNQIPVESHQTRTMCLIWFDARVADAPQEEDKEDGNDSRE